MLNYFRTVTQLWGRHIFTETKNLFNCWKCNSSLKDFALVCDNCATIQKPPSKTNYFSILNLNVNFDVDPKQLTHKYRKMQSVLHPDKFVNKSEDEKHISAEYSSLVNEAYNTLQSPLKRAVHMLSLNNIVIGEDDKASDPQFLMEILELNERIDDSDTNDKLLTLNKDIKETLNRISTDISNSLKVNDIVLTKQHVIKMKYYNSISERINGLLREKGIVE